MEHLKQLQSKGAEIMKLSKYSYQLTEREAEKIQKNLDAFIFQFGIEPVIRKNKNKTYNIYLSTEAEESENYIQHCENIDYLNGWLYGAVQTICGRIKKVT